MDDRLNGRWLPVKDAAHALGLSTDAVRLRVKRGRLTGGRDNKGHLQVFVPTDMALQAQAIAPVPEPVPVPSSPPPPSEPPSSQSAPQSGFQTAAPVPGGGLPAVVVRPSGTELEMLVGQLVNQLQHHHDAELGRLASAHREQVAMLIERIDAAEVRNERLEEMVQDFMRGGNKPWWIWW